MKFLRWLKSVLETKPEYCERCGEETTLSKFRRSNKTLAASIGVGDPPCICTGPTKVKPQVPPRETYSTETIGINPEPTTPPPSNAAPIPPGNQS